MTTRTPQDAFREVIARWEGGFQAMPEDAGNYVDGKLIGTNYGVTPKALATYRGVPASSITRADIQNMPMEEAVAIGVSLYYEGPGFDRLPWCPATEVWCDIGWGSGPRVAIKNMQRMIGESPDGVIGPATIMAYRRWLAERTREGAVEQIAARRIEMYQEFVRQRPANAKFLGGWINRAKWFLPSNPTWWQTWTEDDVQAMPASYADFEDPMRGKIVPPDREDAHREMSTQRIVQSATLAGSALTGAAGIFKWIPQWAVGVMVVALVAVGALWALRSFGIIKRSV